MAGDVKIDTAGIGNIISGIGGGLKSIGQLGKDIRTWITGKEIIDPQARAELEMKLQELEQKALETEAAVALAQSDTNKTEAASTKLFVSGWRPFIGWVCGISIANNFLIRPYLMAFGVQMPELDVSALYPLVFGMLGIVGARTAEKIKGVAAK